MRVMVFLGAWSLVGPLAAQCLKPPIPAQGLATTVVRDVPVTYSDGYRTLANLVYPAGTPPRCGWPLVVYVPGYGQKRYTPYQLASQGFAVLSYDVRGQGDAKTLNPPTRGLTFYRDEVIDLAEQILFARTRWGKLLHPRKVAVVGGSQGGIHAWFAAAFSGRRVTIPGRGRVTFPVVSCVVPQAFLPEVWQHALRGNTLFSMDALNRIAASGKTAVLDPAVVSQFKQYWLAQDPQGWATTLRAEPARAVVPLLRQSTVPILYFHAYLDSITTPLEGWQLLAGLPATATYRTVLSTNGHGSPPNLYEALFQAELRLRWLDRFLWNVPNGVEKEARAVLGVMPLKGSELFLKSYLWDHRHDASLSPPDLAPETWYLTAAGTLSLSPGPAGSPTTIVHRVNPNYTPDRFFRYALYRWTPVLLHNVPLSERAFAMAPLTRDRELGGYARVHLKVIPSAKRFHLAALLLARVPGVSREMMIGIGGRGMIGVQPGKPIDVTIELSPSVCVLPAGSTLRLILRNHWMTEYPMLRLILTAPYFVSGTTQILHGPGTSYVVLPFRKKVRAGLVCPYTTVTTATPADLPFELRAGSSRAGRPYVIAAGFSGQTPGTPLPGGLLPLNVDPLTVYLLMQSGSPWVVNFAGSVPSTGKAPALLKLSHWGPLPPGLAGTRLTFAGWVYTSSANLQGEATNARDVGLR